MQSGDVAISLGTSDTIFVWLENLKENEHQKQDPAGSSTVENLNFPLNSGHQQILGHIFPNPVDRDAYMALIW